MLQPVFNTNVCIYDFESAENFVGKEKLDIALDELFLLPQVLEKPNIIDAKDGRSLSSVHLYDKHIVDLLDINNSSIGRWIIEKIFLSAIHLGYDEHRDIRKMKFNRTWANRMYQNCNALAHRHAFDESVIPHLVCIYYYDVPAESADLIFIDDDGDKQNLRGNQYFEYDEEKQHRIKTQNGRLVCHDAKFLHATSIHKSELPRTCLIIEVGFAPYS
ncbi:MAG: putative 2OG-Fe(II) oxygenase [Colwellia sp.]|nr:putative 2OG-Fe(II) oxygenase [Colwellia sp.]